MGPGDTIVKGGRYDHLVEKFGKEEPAIGFAIVVDELISALSRQKIQISSGEKSSLILYDKERLKDAIQLAMEFGGKDKNTQIPSRKHRISRWNSMWIMENAVLQEACCIFAAKEMCRW